MGEELVFNGKHVLIIYDDLTEQHFVIMVLTNKSNQQTGHTLASSRSSKSSKIQNNRFGGSSINKHRNTSW